MRITITDDRHVPAIGRLVRAGEQLDVDDHVAADLVRLGVAATDEELPAPPDRPAKGDLVEDWRTYAAGIGVEDVDQLTKPQLIEAVEAAESQEN